MKRNFRTNKLTVNQKNINTNTSRSKEKIELRRFKAVSYMNYDF